MSSRLVNVCTVFDSAMELAAEVLVASLVHTHASVDCQLHVFLLHTDARIRPPIKIDLPSNATITCIKVDRIQFDTESHLATYDKLNMFKALPLDVDRVIYLDADILVTEPLTDLATVKLGAHPLAACLDIPTVLGSRMWPDYHLVFAGKTFRSLAFAQEILELRNPIEDYFNAGVLVAERGGWTKIREKAIAFIEGHPPLPFKDQDALVYAVGGNFLRLHPSYNVLSNWIDTPRPPGLRFYLVWRAWAKIAKIWKRQPKIIHFAGKHKPWNVGHPTPYDSMWWRYAAMCQVPPRDERPAPSPARSGAQNEAPLSFREASVQ